MCFSVELFYAMSLYGTVYLASVNKVVYEGNSHVGENLSVNLLGWPRGDLTGASVNRICHDNLLHCV